MRAALTALVLALAMPACGDDLKPAQHDAGVEDAPTSNAVGPCLDRPDRLDNASTNQLPCELISPEFQP